MEESNPKLAVYNIFINFFGEENVDLQENTILIHFPKVTITNENDHSVDITHLWVRVDICDDGTINGTFRMMRSELTVDQFACGYSHSHIQSVNQNNFDRWSDPCLGSGPIRHTITSLSAQFSEEMWNLFCLELSKYVTVESLTGVPYMYLEKIGVNNVRKEKVCFPFYYVGDIPSSELFSRCVKGLINEVIKRKPFGFNFVNGCYGIAMSEKEIFITLSNLFIEYYNSLPSDQRVPKEELFSERILYRGKCINNNLFYLHNNIQNIEDSRDQFIGKELFKFKDEVIKFNITNSENIEKDSNLSIFLSQQLVLTVINKLLTIINNRYGRPTTEEESSPTEEVHFYV